MGDFHDKMQMLIDSTAKGKITGEVVVDQVYAHYQEVHETFNHPDGGQAYYARDSLYDNLSGKIQKIADKTLTEDGTHPEDGVKDVVDSVNDGIRLRAPLEFGDLRNSGHRIVTVGQETVYDVPALIGRQSAEELKQKKHIQEILEPGRYKKGKL